MKEKMMNNIFRMWNHAELCKHWNEESYIYDTLSKYTNDNIIFTPMKNKKDYGYIAEYENEIVIAMRGTENIKSAISNLDSRLYDDNPDDLIKGHLHKGFYQSFEPFKDVIVDYFSANLNCTNKNFSAIEKDIFFTGHSRGGSLALMGHYDFTVFRNVRSYCINFGALPAFSENKF
jgi:hypothetical protein